MLAAYPRVTTAVPEQQSDAVEAGKIASDREIRAQRLEKASQKLQCVDEVITIHIKLLVPHWGSHSNTKAGWGVYRNRK